MPIPGNQKQARSPRSPCEAPSRGSFSPAKDMNTFGPLPPPPGAYPGAEHVLPGQGVKEQGRVVFFPSQAFHGAEPRIVILV